MKTQTLFFYLSLGIAGCGDHIGADGSLAETDVSVTESAVRVANPSQGWQQWGQNSRHTGAVAVSGQIPRDLLASTTYDPFVAQERAEFGSLRGHFQSPLLDGDDVFMAFKTGQYVPCDPPGSFEPLPCASFAWNLQQWHEKRLHWNGSQLVEIWDFESDWKPEPDAFGLFGWEPVFHPVLGDHHVWVPGAGGTVFQLDESTGSVVQRVNPFDTIDAAGTFVAGPLTIDAHGNVFYNVLQLTVDPDPALSSPWFTDIRGAWLVRVDHRGNKVQKVSYAALIPDAPAATDSCHGFYFGVPLPWPPADPVPTAACGAQRPGLNVAPAVAPDGTIFTISTAHLAPTYGYVVAVNPDLTPKWAASMRDRLHDGCGSPDLPFGNEIGNCRPGAAPGVDPVTGDLPAGFVSDLSSASPVVAPDGSVLYGAFGFNSVGRGHLFKFSSSGAFQGAFDFGWDSTPAIFSRDKKKDGVEHYSIIIKDNHYGGANSCFEDDCPVRDPGPFFITELDEELNVEWKFQNTNTQSCQRNADGSIDCTNDHPNGFEWCINAPAVDKNGMVYANSEDGNLYAINKNGHEKARLFLGIASEAAYTPLSLSDSGLVYSENNGKLFLAGDKHQHH